MFELALLERIRESVPLDWAYSHHGLGLALAALAKRTGEAATPKEAIAAMANAAEIYRNGFVDYWLPIADECLSRMQEDLAEMQRRD